MDPATENEAQLKKQIEEQGNIVRQLKASKAPKEQVDDEVKKLLELKKLLLSGDEDSKKFTVKTAKGTRDYGPKEMAVRQAVIRKVVECFQRHGAETIDTPVFELKEILVGKYGDEGNKLIYDLADQGGESLALRYDLTVPFARFLAMNKIKAMKRYQIAKVYRRDQPAVTRGRYREFFQCDFDIAGECGPQIAEVECLRIVYEILRDLKIGEFEIKVNNRKLLDGMLAVSGVDSKQFKTICSSIDKLDKTPWEEVRTEMVKEKYLPEAVADRIGGFVRLRELNPNLTSIDLCEKLLSDPELGKNADAKGALAEIKILMQYCSDFGIIDGVQFDPSLARGLDYYTGTIYEAIVKGFDNQLIISGDMEEERQGVGSVAGGGRYDELVGMFDAKKQSVPCCGISLGIERIFSIMEQKQLADARTTETEVYVVTPQKGFISQRLQLTKELLDAGIKTEYSYKLNPKTLDQYQYCEQRKIPIAVVIASDEITKGVVKIRMIKDREEVDVPRSEMISEVKKRLQNFTAQNGNGN